MKNYFKGFLSSFILHGLVISAIWLYSTSISYDYTPKVVVDISTILIDGVAPKLNATVSGASLAKADMDETIKPAKATIVSVPKVALKNLPVSAAVSAASVENIPLADSSRRYEIAEAGEIASVWAENADWENFEGEAGTLLNIEDFDAGRQAYGKDGETGNAYAEAQSKYIKTSYIYIQKLIKNKVEYPNSAKRNRLKGKVMVQFTVHTDGTVSDIFAETSSGHEILDEAAVNAVKSAAPFPAPPVMVILVVPVDYKFI